MRVKRVAGGLPALLLLVLVTALIGPGQAQALERKIILSFDKDILYTLASDNGGERNSEMAQRMVGLSPGLRRVSIQREGNLLTLLMTTQADDAGLIPFSLIFDKMDLYKMAMAREDVAGINPIMQRLASRDPYLKRAEYRFDQRYSVIDLALDIDKFLADKEAEEAKKAPPKKVEPKKPEPKPEPKKPELKPEPKKPEPKKPELKPEPKKPEPKKPEPKKPEPKPEPKKPEPKKPEPPTYLAVHTTKTPPIIDGALESAVWSSAVPFTITTTGNGGSVEVEVRAVRHGDRIYVALSWPDPTAGTAHKPWVWNPEANEYLSAERIEDSLAFQFSDKKMPGCMTAGSDYEADLWFWRAGRTNPSGFAEDDRVVVSTRKIARANSYQGSGGRSVWIKLFHDEGNLPYKPEILVTRRGDEEPRYLPRTPTGSMADVTGKAAWQGKRWTLEFSRQLHTGHEDDVSLADAKKTYFFAVSLFNASEGKDHSVSEVQTMKFE